jgi:Zn-finger nucleic acid-binding protein
VSACPRCTDGKLVRRRYHEVVVEHCVGCEGFRVSQRDLRRTAGFMATDLVGTLDLDAEIPVQPDPGPGLQCECGAVMENFPYLGMPQVHLDRCEGCEFVWLDAEEIATVALLCARSEARIGRLYAEARRGGVLLPGVQPQSRLARAFGNNPRARAGMAHAAAAEIVLGLFLSS